MTIAENLIKQRGGMTQMELSRLSGVSQRTISAIEVGRIKVPTYGTAVKLAKVLECDPTLFLGIETKKNHTRKMNAVEALKAKLRGK